MSDEDDKQFSRLKAILDGDGTEIREQFVYAGLLLTIFERFKTYVIDHVDGFFSTHMEIKDGTLKYTRAAEFKKLIKEYGSGQPGEHNNQVFRAALHWMRSLDAIDQDELKAVEHLYSLRNEIGHELLLILSDGNKQPITIHEVVAAYGIYAKIVRWWLKEIEFATDPDITQEQYNSIAWDDVASFDTLLLWEILDKSLSHNPLWAEIKKMAQQPEAH